MKNIIQNIIIASILVGFSVFGLLALNDVIKVKKLAQSFRISKSECKVNSSCVKELEEDFRLKLNTRNFWEITK